MPYRTRLLNLGDNVKDDGWEKKIESEDGSSFWVWIFLIGVIMPIFAFILFIVSGPSQKQDNLRLNIRENQLPPQLNQNEINEEQLSKHSNITIEVIEEIKSIIQEINTAKSYDEISGLLRKTIDSKSKNFDLNAWGVERLTSPLSGFQWKEMTAQLSDQSRDVAVGYIKVSGRRSDHSQYRAYFVHQDGRVMIDWEATIGWSKPSFSELLQSKPRQEISVRCLLEKQPGYEIQLGENGYSGYLISSPDLNSYTVAYVALNTDRNQQIDRKLKATLNFGSFITKEPPVKNKRVTLKIRYHEELGEDGSFEITEFSHDDWLTPCASSIQDLETTGKLGKRTEFETGSASTAKPNRL